MVDFSNYKTRIKLTNKLSGLPQAQLNEIIFALNPPPGTIAEQGPNRERVVALLQWVEGPIGCGWETFLEVIHGLCPELVPQLASSVRITPQGWFLVHPYGMLPHFTGRKAELQMLTEWLTKDTIHPLLVLRALGGFGKSALTWHWITEELQPKDWPQVMWWSFYEQLASFDNFLRSAVAYLIGGSAQTLPPSQQLEQLLLAVQQKRVLLVLDGFERGLRAYGSMGAAYQGNEDGEENAADLAMENQLGRDCISPLADQFLRKLAWIIHECFLKQ
ncbi:MAG: hypothetical protein AAGF01_31320 [Cyanobacteria bacterium P01_G01_bin.38]